MDIETVFNSWKNRRCPSCDGVTRTAFRQIGTNAYVTSKRCDKCSVWVEDFRGWWQLWRNRD